ncbi:copper chaperone PCu(A)C [Paracoccus aminophilus]|uniref:Copper chaperone PCu(A)C n=1 Tax=Paracoccus aminophilus JCM 7686 TaxID=1367847 RepID=S5Y1X3_PARAH|nr:copper chaperone PCu(A)C [Paracoccus aminophilus]AGT09730.1 hypothetical protein JCM7686_2674 [Paracoccus aminophilus JCM 7686]
MKTLITAASVAALLPLAAFAQSTEAPAAAAKALPGFGANSDISVSDGYARTTGKGSGSGYAHLQNRSDRECHLNGVTSTAAARTELHTNREDDGVMKMEKVEQITLAPGGEDGLTRGGNHVMFTGFHQKFVEGDQIPLTLDFGDCGTVAITLPVDNRRAPEASGAAGMDHSAMDHSGTEQSGTEHSGH